MTVREEFFRAVEQRCANTPYALSPTPEGFVVHLNLADAQWWGLFERNGLTVSFDYLVEVNEAQRSYTITDRKRVVEWEVGVNGLKVPHFGAVISQEQGRLMQREFRAEWGFRDDASYGQVVSYRLDSSEGRELIRSAAAAVGLREAKGASQMVGIVAALIAVGVVVVMGVIMLLAVMRR